MTPALTLPDEGVRAAFSDGPLGVLVTHERSRAVLDGLLAETVRLGIPVSVFFMDEGTWLLADRPWVEQLPQGHYGACDLSVRSRGIDPPARVLLAGQYHNAMMVCDAARVVSL